MKMMMKPSILTLVCLFAFGSVALADGTLTPKHGGRMAETEGSRLELVVTGDTIDLYVTDHGDKPVVVAKASAKVVLLNQGQKMEVTLQPVTGNQLSGTAKVSGGEHATAVVTVEGLPKRLSARIPDHR
ncbi:MAG: hypothetical protein HQM00_09800 [Magnetococcales bacterium]|nr:hypothetical protein [Magnetococcales bacterium]